MSLLRTGSELNSTRRQRVSYEVTIKSALTTSSSSSSSFDLAASSSSTSLSDEEATGVAKVGAMVRVKALLEVYHVPEVREIDLIGKEGEIKHTAGVWKGKRISTNLPYKVGFFTKVKGRGFVKCFAYLKEDEFGVPLFGVPEI